MCAEIVADGFEHIMNALWLSRGQCDAQAKFQEYYTTSPLLSLFSFEIMAAGARVPRPCCEGTTAHHAAHSHNTFLQDERSYPQGNNNQYLHARKRKFDTTHTAKDLHDMKSPNADNQGLGYGNQDNLSVATGYILKWRTSLEREITLG
jgi:hypothetical protein